MQLIWLMMISILIPGVLLLQVYGGTVQLLVRWAGRIDLTELYFYCIFNVHFHYTCKYDMTYSSSFCHHGSYVAVIGFPTVGQHKLMASCLIVSVFGRRFWNLTTVEPQCCFPRKEVDVVDFCLVSHRRWSADGQWDGRVGLERRSSCWELRNRERIQLLHNCHRPVLWILVERDVISEKLALQQWRRFIWMLLSVNEQFDCICVRHQSSLWLLYVHVLWIKLSVLSLENLMFQPSATAHEINGWMVKTAFSPASHVSLRWNGQIWS